MFSFSTPFRPALSGLRTLTLAGVVCALAAPSALADEQVVTRTADGYSVDIPAHFEELPTPDFTLSYGVLVLPDGTDGGTIFGMGAAPADTLDEMVQDLVREGAEIVGPDTVVINDLSFTQRRFSVEAPFGALQGFLLFADEPRADGTVLRVALMHLNIDEAMVEMRNRQILGSLQRAAGADAAEAEAAFWARIRASNDRADYEAYLEAYPDGRYAALARNNLRRLDRLGQ